MPKTPRVFDEGDFEEFCNDTWLIILNSFRSARDFFESQCRPRPQRISRVYVVDKARVLLGFSPRFNFNELISSTSIPASEFGQRRVDIFPISMGAQNSFATSRSYSPFSGGCAKNPKLTHDAYRILHGHDATLPTKRFLHELAIARHHHTRSLADFLVHSLVAADRFRIQITDFHSENTLRIAAGDRVLFPDASFSLLLPNGFRFTYHVELDNSTEPIRSIERLDSWQHKLHLYHQHAINSRDRFKLLVVTTKNSSRLSHILDLAAQLNPNPSYSLVCGVALPEYLATSEPLSTACFRDERNMRIPLFRTTNMFRWAFNRTPIETP